jgi:hypothetical protein
MFDLLTLSGRSFTNADDERGPKVVVIIEPLARDLFGTTSPLGRLIRFGRDSPQYEGVGVVSGRSCVWPDFRSRRQS